MLNISWDLLFSQTQLPSKYDSAIGRHGQWFRWLRGITCPCITTETAQPDINCTLCKGSGKIYKSPLNMQIFNEEIKHNDTGRLYAKNKPIVYVNSVLHKTTSLTVATVQPDLDNYIQLDPPYPKHYEQIRCTYEFSPVISVVSENSEVIGTNTLRATTLRFTDKGKTIDGSVVAVTRVRNVTKSLTYTVSSISKHFIYISAMSSWTVGDVLEVDYTYVRPFTLLMTKVSPKMKYDKSYVLEQSDALLVVPSYMRVGPDDLFTALSERPLGTMVINPNIHAGNDIISRQYDICNIIDIIDKNGVSYPVNTSVEIYGRNELKWKVTKPTVNYTVQFLYHPTYVALRQEANIRNAENADFVSRVNLMLYEKLSNRVF